MKSSLKERPASEAQPDRLTNEKIPGKFKRGLNSVKSGVGRAEEGRFDGRPVVIFGLSRPKLNYLLFFLCSSLFTEFFFKFTVYASPKGFLYTALFATIGGLFAYFLSSGFSPRANRIIGLVLTGICSLWCSTQFVYYSIFKTPLSFRSMLNGTRQVIGNFLLSALIAIAKCLPGIIVLFSPFIFLAVFGRRLFDCSRTPAALRFKNIVIVFCVFAVCIGSINLSGRNGKKSYDENAAAQYYSSAFDIALSQPLFGVMTGLRLDLQHLIFPGAYKSNHSGALDEGGLDDRYLTESLPACAGAEEVPSGPNIMSIDFDSLIQNETDSTLLDMHKYFSSITPTQKNEYTGIYEGYNLIYMCCESFSSYAIDKDLTPTLYKLANEGLRFDNFYNPLWGVSTSDGEYVACQGLIPKSGVWSFWRSSNNWLPFALGNQFRKLPGYSEPVAYHNNTYNYYNRDQSHPNMGYNYKGLGNGLDVKATWPESDLEMMQKTVPQLLESGAPFHAYYMTVSGHMNYDFTGNYIAAKNRSLVENLDLNEQCKAYLACNIELDRAMQYVLEQLEATGQLDNTVIVMSPDHYPYALDKDDIDTLAGHEVEENFELYKSSLIIWHNGDQSRVITEPVSSLDILPTVSNMFGLEYDSRLLMGRDVFGGTMPLVIFNDRSFITDRCAYNANTKEVTSFTGEEISQEYLTGVKNIVSNRFKYSALILDRDYYSKVIERW